MWTIDSSAGCVTVSGLYKVSQEERSIFWEVIVSVILNKKVHMYTCLIPNGFRDIVISLYSTLYTVQTSNTHVITRVAKCIYVEGGIFENIFLRIWTLLGKSLVTHVPAATNRRGRPLLAKGSPNTHPRGNEKSRVTQELLEMVIYNRFASKLQKKSSVHSVHPTPVWRRGRIPPP
jgi:hypothetical protein